jgi:hypothetical protein
MTRPASSLAIVLALAAAPLAAQEKAPLSAIDWLSQSIDPSAAPTGQPGTTAPRGLDEPPVADTVSTPDITVQPLDRASPDGVGLLPPATTGLPRSLWAGSDPGTLAALLRAQVGDSLPATRDLLLTVLLAQADPPVPSDGTLYLARVDRLLDMGALDPAQSLLEAADRDAPEVFRRWFDVSLLTGTEDAACGLIRTRPSLASTYPARIFCLARNGDWQAAALTLSNARALGDITPEEEALLSRFLDPELYEGDPPLAAPSRPSPLVFRLREAIGDGLPTASLPRAFAHADLRSTVAWRNRIAAAERLARNGAIPGAVLLAAYTEQTPAASGGVWDRARAIQAFDAALEAQDPAAVATSLPPAWSAMQAIRAEVPFARLYADRLSALDLPDDTAALAFRIALLSPDYETAALARIPATGEEDLLIAVARGNLAGIVTTDPRARGVVAGFTGALVSEPLASLIRDGRVGEAILRAIAATDQGLAGDATALGEGLSALRLLGLESTARAAALQFLLLDRPA